MRKINLFGFQETFLSRNFVTLFALALACINEILHKPSVGLEIDHKTVFVFLVYLTM